LAGLNTNRVGAVVAVEVCDRKLQAGSNRRGGSLGNIGSGCHACDRHQKKKRQKRANEYRDCGIEEPATNRFMHGFGSNYDDYRRQTQVYNTTEQSAKKIPDFDSRALEGEASADLGGEGAAYRGAGAKEIAKSTRREAELFEAGDGRENRASRGVRADAGNIGGVVHGYRKRSDIGDVVRAGIVAIENVEKFDERRGREALAECERTADTEIPLDIRSPAKFIQRRLDAIHGDAVRAVRIGDGEGARRFCLPEKRQFESGRKAEHAGQDETVADVFT